MLLSEKVRDVGERKLQRRCSARTDHANIAACTIAVVNEAS